MPRPKYPLKPLLEHRERKVESATAELAGAIREHVVAETVRVRAVAEKTDAEAQARALKEAEAARLARGELRAVDLVRGGAWEESAQRHIDVLAEAARAAEGRSARAALAEDGARAGLAEKMAEQDVIAKDEARFDANVARRVLAAEEEAASELVSGRARK